MIVLGAGALAAALVSVFALSDRIGNPPGADLATISVSVSKMTALSDFPTERLGKDLSLGGVPKALDLGAQMLRAQSNRGSLSPVLSGPPRQQPAPATPATTIGAPTGVTSAPPSRLTGTETSTTTHSSTTTATAPISSAASDGTRASASPSPTEVRRPKFPSNEYRADVENQLRQLMVDDEAPTDLALDVVYVSVTETVDSSGQPVPPAQVAAELKTALEKVDTDADADPLGWTVVVDFKLEGLGNVPLLLMWSIDGIDVPATWSAENLAYRITASTENDGGFAEIWVPDLKMSGNYNVNVELSYESSGLPAAQGHSGLPNS